MNYVYFQDGKWAGHFQICDLRETPLRYELLSLF